jgi:ribosomal-protein-alanine N-acetyltransferase
VRGGQIRTERLVLVSVGGDFIAAALDGRLEDARRISGVAVSARWAKDNEDVLRIRLTQLQGDSGAEPWLLRLMVLRSTSEFVGHTNFHEPPADRGWVEIGYSVEPRDRRRGYATEAATAMFEWAGRRGVHRFRASVSPRNEASLSMVEKMGFRPIGMQIDEVDGEEIVFEATLDEVRAATG